MRNAQSEIIGNMDSVLIAITDGRSIPMRELRDLPPWRAVLLARVAAKAGAMEQKDVDLLVEEVEEVTRVGGLGRLTQPDDGS